MNDIQRLKTNFRQSKAWKEYRLKRRENDAKDFLTHKKLSNKFNLHHLDLNTDHYTDLSDDSHFECLNNKSHDCIHFLYQYYKKDPEVLDRLKELLDRMIELNNR